MKIGIVTHYAGNNAGGMLQSYALLETVKRICPEAEVHVLDYLHSPRRKRPTARGVFRQSYRKNKSVPKSLLHAALCANERLYSHGRSRYQDFIEEYCALDPDSRVDAEWNLVCTGYDVLISGSDQVFAGMKPYFYLDTTQERQPLKIAYAPSFGNLDDIHESNYPWIRERLAAYQALSCRETDGAALIEQLTGRPCPILLDPTLLLAANDWLSIAKRPAGVPDGGYVLCYELWRCPNTMACAKKAARDLGLPLVHVNNTNEGIKYYNRIGPLEFLWLVAHASHVVSHSFHGTIFSLLFGTPFHVVITRAAQARLTTLLSLVGMEERRIHDSSGLDTSRPYSEAGEIQKYIQARKQGSLEYLRAALRKCGAP